MQEPPPVRVSRARAQPGTESPCTTTTLAWTCRYRAVRAACGTLHLGGSSGPKHVSTRNKFCGWSMEGRGESHPGIGQLEQQVQSWVSQGGPQMQGHHSHPGGDNWGALSVWGGAEAFWQDWLAREGHGRRSVASPPVGPRAESR